MNDMDRKTLEALWPPNATVDRDKLIAAVERLVNDAIAAERNRCIAVCRERAAVWRRTNQAKSDIPAARDEARARANEAGYLADLLETVPAVREELEN